MKKSAVFIFVFVLGLTFTGQAQFVTEGGTTVSVQNMTITNRDSRYKTIPTRQIHLDFHTSEHIPGVGSQFDKEQFQKALKLGHVNSITVFGKGHHSWSYYPTKVGKMHPTLTFDLLGEQIKACHEIGVRAPIYYTVGWSATDAEEHPEWCAQNLDGSYVVSNGDFTSKPDDPKPHFSWKNLCMSGGYHDHIMEQVEEICKNYPVDGFFFDIYQIEKLCYCDNCRKGMDEEGVDIYDEEQVAAYNARKMKRHMRDLRNLIEKYHPEATVFFNGTTSLKRRNNFLFGMHEYNTHQELEDLPTTWGGYDKLPLQSKFFLNSGYSVMAMSGKFHTAWGEFGGFKHPNAIKYEAAAMVSYGACCSIGDQLHPAGEMDLATYRNIGVGYEYVEKIEEYGVGGMPVARLGIWRTAVPEHDEGVVKMLLETQNNFNIVDPSQKLESYEVIIIPGVANLDKQQADRLNTFVDNGGKLLVVGEGALNEAKTDFVLDVGATYLGPAEYQIDYLLVNADIQTGVVSSPFLNYEAALRCQPAAGSDILAHIREPYFDRTYERYCSHQNTPYQLNNAAHPGIIKNGNVIYIAHPIDKLYFEHGAQLHRQVFINALRLLHDTPMVETELPSAGRLAFLHQPGKNRYVAHLLYGPPLQRGRCLVIEDLPTLYDIPVRIDSPKKIKRAMMIPSGKILQMTTDKGYTTVNVPEFECHTGVVFEY